MTKTSKSYRKLCKVIFAPVLWKKYHKFSPSQSFFAIWSQVPRETSLEEFLALSLKFPLLLVPAGGFPPHVCQYKLAEAHKILYWVFLSPRWLSRSAPHLMRLNILVHLLCPPEQQECFYKA